MTEAADRPRAQAIKEWREILGNDHVLTGEDIDRHYPQCTTGTQRRVPAVIRIHRRSVTESQGDYIENQLRPVIRIAARYRVALHPISTGRNWGYGTWLPPGNQCVVVDLSAINRIISMDEDLGVVTLEPGVTQNDLAEYFQQRKLPYLVPVTGAGPGCSILANALERGYGITPIADHFSAVMALQALLADGQMYSSPLTELTGGMPPPQFKWGIGAYLDGIFSQSGFGIVTDMTIALARRPQSTRVFALSVKVDRDIEALVDIVREIRKQLPGLVGGINLLNARRALAMMADYPWEKLGPDGLIPQRTLLDLQRSYGIGDWTMFGTLYGTDRTVAAAMSVIKGLCKPLGRQVMFASRSQAQFLEKVASLVPATGLRMRLRKRTRMLRMAAELAEGIPNETALPLAYWRTRSAARPTENMNPARDGCGLIWYAPLIPMKSERVKTFVEMLTRILIQHNFEPLVTLTTVNDYCFDASIPLLFERSDQSETGRAQKCFDALMNEGLRLGFVPYRLPIDAQAHQATGDTNHARLRDAFKTAVDPMGILSPGRY